MQICVNEALETLVNVEPEKILTYCLQFKQILFLLNLNMNLVCSKEYSRV